MSAQVLFSSSNELWKNDKMRGLPHFITFSYFNKLNNIGARKLDSDCHMPLKLL